MEFDTLSHSTPRRDRNYLASLIQRIGALQVVEIGCYVGQTTLSLVRAAPDVTVHAIDHFEGNPADDIAGLFRQHGKGVIHHTFCRNLRDYLFQRVFLHVGTSAQYAAIWPFEVDLVFIDADHRYFQVKRDIELWMPHVRDGGILCGHDYGIFDGVTQAADELGPDEVVGFVWKKEIRKQSRNGVRRTG